jgi:hypothetical protein
MQTKVLIPRSYEQGQLLLEQMCRKYGSIVNVEVETAEAVRSVAPGLRCRCYLGKKAIVPRMF